jgi:ParB-like chromosome segregation protein Spo0J
MHTLPVDPESIFIGERHRALNDEAVARLQASISDIGLQHPISIRVVDEMEIDGELVAGVPVLVAGRHRLEAVRRLKWQRVDCVEVNDDALKAEMWEIAENLHRCDLTKEQRDEHIRRYAELIEAVEKVSGQVVQKLSGPKGGRPKEAAAKIAEATGLSQRTVRRALNPQPIPLPAEPQDVTEQQFRALMGAWNRAGSEARDLFLAEVAERIAA